MVIISMYGMYLISYTGVSLLYPHKLSHMELADTFTLLHFSISMSGI